MQLAESFFGVNILTTKEQLGSRPVFGVSVEIGNKAEVKQAENFEKDFERYNAMFFTSLVGEVHKYLIRLTPIHSGKLRGGWTAFLDKHQIDYTKQIRDTSLYDAWKATNITTEHKYYAFNSQKIEEGKDLSVSEDKLPTMTDVTLLNFVPYKDFLEFGTNKIQGRHFSELARYRGEEHFTKNYEAWFSKLQQAGKIVRPPKVGEIK